MTPSEVAAAVSELKPRFLDGLAPPEVKAVLATAKLRRYLANSVVTNQGHPADHLFLLVSGRARFFYITPDGQKTLLLWLPPGETFGDAAFLSKPLPYLVSAETVKNSYVLVWDRATVRRLVALHPRLVENALLIAFDYLVAYRACMCRSPAIPRASGLPPCWSTSPAGSARKSPEALNSTSTMKNWPTRPTSPCSPRAGC